MVAVVVVASVVVAVVWVVIVVTVVGADVACGVVDNGAVLEALVEVTFIEVFLVGQGVGVMAAASVAATTNLGVSECSAETTLIGVNLFSSSSSICCCSLEKNSSHKSLTWASSSYKTSYFES